MKKTQVSIEFMVFVGVSIILLLIFTSVAAYYIKITSRQQAYYSGQELAASIKSEINTASMVENNYNRKVRIPGQLNGKDYGLEIAGREVVVAYGGNDYSELIASEIAAGNGIDVNPVRGNGGFLKVSKDGSGVIKVELVS